MNRPAPIRLVLTGVGLCVLAAATNRYRRGLQRDRERLYTFEPSTLDTPFGRVEYAQAGEGPPVLVVHGVFGGNDFGVGSNRVNVPSGYRIISPSRFGYLGSPISRPILHPRRRLTRSRRC